MRNGTMGSAKCLLPALLFFPCLCGPGQPKMEFIRVSPDGADFVLADSGRRFLAWGVNYDHDESENGRLIEDYWVDEWQKVEEDFAEIEALGANTVRIHLQVGKFMDTPEKANDAALRQLARLLELAERNHLYLDLTGLGCYHKKDVPAWYDAMDETARWAVQARFWEAVARTCADSPAVFCYDLMNEPIVGGGKNPGDWLTGELGGKFFVQRITLDAKGRRNVEIARAWVDHLVAAIRKVDKRHMITVGEIPWVMVWPNAKPFFSSKEVGENLDFYSVHFYPEKGEVSKALTALAKYDTGKPLVVEEMFPLKCSTDELLEFVDGSRKHADGWISFYWGKTIEQLESEKGNLAAAITAAWLRKFRAKGAEILGENGK